MIYKPQNNWICIGKVNECFTDEQFKQLEDEYEFDGQDIHIYEMYCDAYGNFHYHFEFMGIKTMGIKKIDAQTKSIWSEETRDSIEFELCLELLSEDMMNDIFKNHLIYK